MNFPDVTDVDIVFSTAKIPQSLVEEAYAKGFDKSSNPYNQLFSTLFFKGGKINFKDDLDEDYRTRGYRYLLSIMHSFEPRHEHKEAVCAYILSEIADETESTKD